jgi:hypothetical protein
MFYAKMLFNDACQTKGNIQTATSIAAESILLKWAMRYMCQAITNSRAFLGWSQKSRWGPHHENGLGQWNIALFILWVFLC